MSGLAHLRCHSLLQYFVMGEYERTNSHPVTAICEELVNFFDRRKAEGAQQLIFNAKKRLALE